MQPSRQNVQAELPSVGITDASTDATKAIGVSGLRSFWRQLMIAHSPFATRTSEYLPLRISRFSSAASAHKHRNLFDFRRLDR
jgi:hypothetical protein